MSGAAWAWVFATKADQERIAALEEMLEAADEAIKAAWPDVYAPIGDVTYAQKWRRLIAARDRYATLRGWLGGPPL